MNRMRDRVGLSISPLFLRLLLGIVFVWAGLAKLSSTFDVQGEDAVILAGMGVIPPPLPKPIVSPPAPRPAETQPAAPKEPAKEPTKAPETPKAPPPEGPKAPTGKADAGGARIVLARQALPVLTAADFPKPVSVPTVHALTLMVYKAAHPADPGAMALWPLAFGEGHWPVYIAWTVALSELVGGAAVLLGLFTRLLALVLAGVMAGAMWLTQIGPAVQSGKTQLGFLPDYPVFDGQKWETLLFQFALLMAALALAFCGPGRASLDRAILGGPNGEEEAE